MNFYSSKDFFGTVVLSTKLSKVYAELDRLTHIFSNSNSTVPPHIHDTAITDYPLRNFPNISAFFQQLPLTSTLQVYPNHDIVLTHGNGHER